MEPWNNIDPTWDWIVGWGIKITVGCLILLFFIALVKMTKDQKQLEKELSGDDEEEED